jgi:chemotaxis-related protein WspD
VLGLVNVRGELVITVSLGQALGIESPTPQTPSGPPNRTARHRLLIVSHEGERVALLVQEIQGIARINMEDLKDVPATVVHGSRRCVSGVLSWGGKTVGFLDDQKLFKLVNKSLG